MFQIALFSLGLLIGAVLVRYGIGIGTRIVYRTKEDLPAFGKTEEPVTQSHTYEVEENE